MRDKRSKRANLGSAVRFEPLEQRQMMSATIAFFDDPGYVNTAPGSDANALLQQVQTEGESVRTFAGTDAASFTAGLSGANVLVIPALDEGDLGASLSPGAIGVIDQFVDNGGGLIITGDTASHFVNFLNDTFGFSVISADGGGAAPYHLTSGADGTDFEDDANPLPENTDASAVNIASLPAGSDNFYDAYYDVNTAGALMPYGGRSSICFLDWDWTNGGPNGTVDGGWNAVLSSAIQQVSGASTQLQASVIGLGTNAYSLAVGQSFDFAADVLPASGSGPTPTGTVTFYEAGENKGTFDLTNGQLVETFTVDSPGPTTFDAVYSGDSNYAPSTSNTVSQTYTPASSAVGRIISAPAPQNIVSGQPLSVRTAVQFTNSGSTLKGLFTEQLYLSTSADGLSENPILLSTKTVDAKVGPGKKLQAAFSSHPLKMPIAEGTYYPVVEITDPLGDIDQVTLPNAVTIAAPVVNLSASLGEVKPLTIAPGKAGTVTVTLTDFGNIIATGNLQITVYSSSTAPNVTLGTLAVSRLSLRPNKSRKFTVRLKMPATLAAAQYTPCTTVSFDSQSTTAVGTPFNVG